MRASINPKGGTAPGKMNYLKAVEQRRLLNRCGCSSVHREQRTLDALH